MSEPSDGGWWFIISHLTFGKKKNNTLRIKVKSTDRDSQKAINSSTMSTALKYTVRGGSFLSLGYFAYDYQTQHPMRKMKSYNIREAAIRFHNTLTIMPKTMTLDDLSKYNGRDGKAILFAADGWIWDASQSESFQESYGFFKGADASVALAKMSMDPGDVNRTDWEDLSEKELESLHSWTKYFHEKYFIVGKLKEYPREKLQKTWRW